MKPFDPTVFIRELYDAAFDDEALHAACARLGGEGLSSIHAFEHVRAEAGHQAFVTFGALDLSAAAQVLDVDIEENLGLQAVERARPGVPFHTASFMDLSALHPEGATRAFFDPHDFDKALLMRLPSAPGSVSHVTFFRRRSDPDFEQHHSLLVAEQARHLSTVHKVRDLRLSAERRAFVSREMQKLARPVEAMMILTPSLRVIEADPIASSILERGDPFRVRSGRLYSASAEPGQDTASLEAFLKLSNANSPPFRLRGARGDVFRLIAMPVGPDQLSASLCMSGGAIAVVIEARPIRRSLDLEGFALAYRLSPAETRLLGALLDASTAADAARRLGVSPNTAKTHLSNIFRKTETETQPQLMLLLGRFL